MIEKRKFDEVKRRLGDRYNRDKTTLNDSYSYENRRKSILSRDFSIYNILPFIKRERNLGIWLYNNRLGVVAVSVTYLIMLMIVLFVKYDITPRNSIERVLIEVDKSVVEDKKDVITLIPQPSEEMALQYNQEMQPKLIENYIIDQNLDGGSEDSDSFDKDGEKMYDDIESLEQAIRTNQENYQKGLALIEEREMERRRVMEQEKIASNKNKLKKATLGFKRGNVTVSYDLKGRKALDLEVPAYRCEGGGKVVVNIVVSNIGEVITASINNTQGVTDSCIPEKALEAAKNSLFSSEHGTPRQYGTITYMFVAQ